MKFSDKTSNTNHTGISGTPLHFQEDTNPFQKNIQEEKGRSSYTGSEVKTGKRPRILKPVYSVRLF